MNEYIEDAMDLKERCAYCKHLHQTKELVNRKWKETNICTMWLDVGETQEPLLLTLGEDLYKCRCECFERKRNDKRTGNL